MSEGLQLAPRQFTRSSCDCVDCAKFCRMHPGHLIPSDLFRIADALVRDGKIETTTEVFTFMRASKGAVVGNAATGQLYRIGTITPKMTDEGACIFLTEEGRCSIHAVAPFGCAYFSEHDEKRQADIYSMWSLRLIAETPAYEVARQALIARDGGAAEPFTPTEKDE